MKPRTQLSDRLEVGRVSPAPALAQAPAQAPAPAPALALAPAPAWRAPEAP